MKFIKNDEEVTTIFTSQLGIILEEKASSLTQGYTGDYFEGSGRHIRERKRERK